MQTIPLGRYRHYKGNDYSVVGFAQHSETKEVMVRSNGRPLEEAFAIETQCTKENAAMDDAKEGSRAFMEKRPPVFRGRAAK